MAHCPECDAEIDVGDEIEEGQTLDCPECEATLEVVTANPLELNVVAAKDEEEDAY